MPGEKSIKPYWKEQLDALVPEPGSFDKEASWEKLQSRLEKKPRRLVWIPWMAAAAIAGIVLLLVFRKSQPDLISTGDKLVKTPVKETSQPGVTIKEKEDKNIPLVSSPSTPVNELPGQKEKAIPPENAVAVEKNDDEPVQALTTVNDIVLPVKIDTVATTTNTGIPAPVAKKKLSIVHNNEIGTPAATMPAEEKSVAKTSPLSFPGFRKPSLPDNTDIIENSTSIKPKKSILPFSGLISQKE